MSIKTCPCPYIPCSLRGNCEGCVAKSRKDKTLVNCMEETAESYGACLPIKLPATEIEKDYEAMSARCARLVQECLEQKPDSLLCFPAGTTVTGTCKVLKQMQEKGEIDFSRAHFVALDEWMDLEDDSENCTNFLRKHLYGPLGIKEENMTLFNTHAKDPQQECKRVDQVIFDRGGIDLMILGLGMNGHLGLNEPGGDFADYAKVIELSETTMSVGQKYFSGPMKLTRGITLGVHHMFETKKVILQVSGDAKKDIVYDLYHAQPSEALPGSVFKLLDNSLIVMDEAAGARIRDLV